MPILDVSDAFDASFWDEFALHRRVETVGNDGFATTEDNATRPYYGVIAAASPNDLQRLPEADVALKSITIVTKTRLQLASRNDADPTKTIKADVVEWAGDFYQVVHVDDYSRYGAGFIWALAQAIDYQIAPPTPEAPVPAPEETDGQ